MLKSNLFIFIVLLFILLTGSGANAQSNDCSQTLLKAQDTYKEGRINEIEEMLQPCLETGLTKTEKIEAYRLLTLTYLYFNETVKAEGAMTHLLKNDPEYKIRQSDPTEFVNLFNSFRTTPIILVGGKFGVNASDVDVIKNFSLDNSAAVRGDYKSKVGIQGGLTFQFPLSKKLALITEVLYVMKSYSYSDSLFGYANLVFPEKQAYLEVPLLLNYSFGTGKWVPYLNLGGSAGYMFNATTSPVRTDKTGTDIQREIKVGDITITKLRNSFNFNIVASLGLKVKDVIGRGYLLAEIRYTHGINNLVNVENRYSNSDLMYKYMYIDNNFRINSFQYSLGYSYPLYKPKLKRSSRKEKEQN